MWKSCAENVYKYIYTFFNAPTIPEVEEESNVDEDDDIIVLSMYNYFYRDNIGGSEEIEEDSLSSNYFSVEKLNTYVIEEYCVE